MSTDWICSKCKKREIAGGKAVRYISTLLAVEIFGKGWCWVLRCGKCIRGKRHKPGEEFVFYE